MTRITNINDLKQKTMGLFDKKEEPVAFIDLILIMILIAFLMVWIGVISGEVGLLEKKINRIQKNDSINRSQTFSHP